MRKGGCMARTKESAGSVTGWLVSWIPIISSPISLIRAQAGRWSRPGIFAANRLSRTTGLVTTMNLSGAEGRSLGLQRMHPVGRLMVGWRNPPSTPSQSQDCPGNHFYINHPLLSPACIPSPWPAREHNQAPSRDAYRRR